MAHLTITAKQVTAEKNFRRLRYLCDAIVRELPRPRHLGLRPGTPEWEAWLVLERVAVARAVEAEEELREAYAGIAPDDADAMSTEVNEQLDRMDGVAPRPVSLRCVRTSPPMYQVELDDDSFATTTRETAVAACEANETGGTVVSPDGARERVLPKRLACEGA
jgi:hypothetical protein